MRAFRHIVSLILAVTVIAVGVPIFCPQDRNLDSAVDLTDAILLVKDFARSAEAPASFTEGVEHAVSALCMVAGLRRVITGDTPQSGAFLQSPGLVCLVSLCPVPVTTDSWTGVPDARPGYTSLAPEPVIPPPKRALA